MPNVPDRTDPEGQLAALWSLWETRHGDGVHRWLAAIVARKWPTVPATSQLVDDCVSDALASAGEALMCGREIRNLSAWVIKVAERSLRQRFENPLTYRPLDEDRLVGPPLCEGYGAAQSEQVARLRAEALAKVLAKARDVLPTIGRGQVVDVLEVFLDAVEQGVPDLPASVVADTLGISEAAVRTLLGRGAGPPPRPSAPGRSLGRPTTPRVV